MRPWNDIFPTPWTVEFDPMGLPHIEAANNHVVNGYFGLDEGTMQRIVSCVNACDGVENSELDSAARGETVVILSTSPGFRESIARATSAEAVTPEDLEDVTRE